jgi:hypothetical protein
MVPAGGGDDQKLLDRPHPAALHGAGKRRWHRPARHLGVDRSDRFQNGVRSSERITTINGSGLNVDMGSCMLVDRINKSNDRLGFSPQYD